jgi:hypothetical protein
MTVVLPDNNLFVAVPARLRAFTTLDELPIISASNESTRGIKNKQTNGMLEETGHA